MVEIFDCLREGLWIEQQFNGTNTGILLQSGFDAVGNRISAVYFLDLSLVRDIRSILFIGKGIVNTLDILLNRTQLIRAPCRVTLDVFGSFLFGITFRLRVLHAPRPLCDGNFFVSIHQGAV